MYCKGRSKYRQGQEMLPAILKVCSFVYCVVVLVALSDANIMSEIEFSTIVVSDGINPHVFETNLLRYVDIVDCVKECRAHTTCKFINYSKRMNLCFLNHFYTHSMNSYVFVHKEKSRGYVCWLRPGFKVMYGRISLNLDTCDPAPSCEVQSCTIKDPIGSFEHYGNMYAVGSKQAYGCLNHSTNTMYKQIDVCETSGEWSLKEIPCSYTNITMFVMAGYGRKMLYYISDVNVSQSEAEKRCKKENAHLLTVRFGKKIEALKKNFGTGGPFAHLWIDAHLRDDLNWITSDGHLIPPSVLAQSDNNENHKCATANNEWKLLPTDCADVNGYICETAV